MKILLVDDNRDFCDIFAIGVEGRAEVTTTSTVQSAIEYLEHEKFDLIIVDWMLPFGSGKQLLDWMHGHEGITGNPKVWVNTTLPEKAIKQHTNGHQVFNKLLGGINEAIDAEVGM